MKSRLILTAIAMAMVVLFAGCKKDDYVEVDGVCPIVVMTSPANGETSVALSKNITVTFNEPMNPATITTASLLLNGSSAVAGTITYQGQTATFSPSSPLLPNTTYIGKVTTAVKDPSRNALQQAHIWTFSTGVTVTPIVISTDPVNGATGVVLNKMVTATFSMTMDPATLNASTFVVRHGTTAVSGTVTLADTTVSFTPSSNLLPDTLYTATITTGAKNLAGVSIAADYVWTFRAGTVLAPTVISTIPVNNAVAVPQNQVVSATFSEPMNPATLNGTSFMLKQGLTPVSGTVSTTGATASFTPTNPLASGTVYTATVTTGAKNFAGTSIANNYTWSFTTVVIPGPTVIFTFPVNNANGVPLNQVVTATFNQAMDQSTLISANFTLKQGVTTVPGSVSRTGTTISYTPTFNLVSGTTYTATITTGVKSLAGIPMANDYVWTFTTIVIPPPTVISTIPVNLASNVPLNQVVSATFSEPMNASTLNSGTFTLRMGATLVPGVVNYSGTTATFTPNVNLLSDTTYTATITTGAQSASSVPMASNYVWTFSTVGHMGPANPDMGTVSRFGIVAGVGISNNAGFSEIHDLDVGISPGVRSSVTGFPPAIVVNGAIYCSDDPLPVGTAAMLIQAKQDLTDVYLYCEGASSPAPVGVSGDIGGSTLPPGIYKSASTLMIQNGSLTLDAQGDANAVWIFQVASGFTTVGGAGGNVILIGGAQAKNVFWQTGTSATIGDFTSFKGNVFALTSITMNSGAVADGRMLARNGSVVMTSTNFINRP